MHCQKPWILNSVRTYIQSSLLIIRLERYNYVYKKIFDAFFFLFSPFCKFVVALFRLIVFDIFFSNLKNKKFNHVLRITEQWINVGKKCNNNSYCNSITTAKKNVLFIGGVCVHFQHWKMKIIHG